MAAGVSFAEEAAAQRGEEGELVNRTGAGQAIPPALEQQNDGENLATRAV